MKWLRLALRTLLTLLLLFGLYVAVMLLVGTVSDYQPDDIEPLTPFRESDVHVHADSTFTALIWNLGYGGLGRESDFFFDNGRYLTSGGHDVRPSREVVRKNVEGIIQTIRSHPADYFLLQEVDRHSRRSFFTNEFELIADALPGYAAFFATNYRVWHMPLPLLEPWNAYGQVESGLATYLKVLPYESFRYQLPGNFEWPTRIFQLDRCVSLHRIRTRFGPDLVVMNIHHSAYDDGALKRQQNDFLRKLAIGEYERGSFVLIGGDWNQCPPGFPFDKFMPGRTQGYTQLNLPADFMPEGWQWVYDPDTPTNRKVRDRYAPDSTFVTLIDFYLLSPNLEALEVHTIDLDFEYSDHQPVWLKARVREGETERQSEGETE